MYKKSIYPTKSIYLGTIEYIQDDTPTEEMIAFERKVDKVTTITNYKPLNKKIGYYYLKRITPITKYMTEREMKSFLSLSQINQIVVRENKKERLKDIVVPINDNVVGLQEKETNEKQQEYFGDYRQEKDQAKIKKYKAAHDNKAA